jgi:hypothetical protein
MPQPRRAGLVDTALRCYTRRWRTRHGDEAAEVALLLMRDGVPAHSIAWSYLKGAARDRLTPRPGGHFAATAAALLAVAGSLGVALALLSASVPASAASSVHARTARRDDAAARLVMLLNCGGLHGVTVKKALPSLQARHVKITWDIAAGRTGGDAVPGGSYYVAGGRALSPGSIAVRVTAARPAGHPGADGHAGRC